MNRLIILLSVILITSCTSIKKYNAQISKLHSPKELKEDTNFAYYKLQKLHPNLYLYISKEKLDAKFDSLKNTLNSPLSSRVFYRKLTPVITSIGQGHTSVNPPRKIQTKEDKKEKGKLKSPFKNLEFHKINDQVILTNTFGKDSTNLIGSQLIAINNIKTKELLKSFKNMYTGDGYNKTFVPEFTSKYIGSFYLNYYGLKDSIKLDYKYKDSLYSKYVYAYPKKDKSKKEVKKDSIKTQKLTKAEKKIAKKKKKERKKWEFVHGYNKFTKQQIRKLTFLDSTANSKTAYLKIRSFVYGDYKTFYEETFTKIDSAKIKNLIIDLRDNTGGRLKEIAYLYSYLTDKPYKFVKKPEMTKAGNWYYPYIHNKSILIKSFATLLYPLAKLTQIKWVKRIHKVPHLNLKEAKLKEPKKNNYKGKIYVITNGMSFSASSIFSNYLKETKRAFFVGDETGGANNSTVAGKFAFITLPNSKLKLNIGLLNMKKLYQTKIKGHGIKPDKYIPTTTINKDEQLDWVIEDINRE